MPRIPYRMAMQLASLAAIGAATAGVVPAPANERVERTAWIMGTRAAVAVEALDRTAALEASEAALDAFVAVDDLLSTWRGETDLARLNRAPLGQPLRPAPALAALLTEVDGWVRSTNGAFDPAVGALVDAWDLRGDGRVPSEAELAAALSATGRAGVVWSPDEGSVTRLRANAWLDAGGFGKGAALRAAVDALSERHVVSAVLDLGGQLVFVGDEPHTVSVAHPSTRERAVTTLLVTGSSVATSAQSERRIEVDGRRFGHVLDPRTGRPVPAWGSVTVIHQDPLIADVLATALFVLGPTDGLRFAERLHVAALFLVDDGGEPTAIVTDPMQTHLTFPFTTDP